MHIWHDAMCLSSKPNVESLIDSKLQLMGVLQSTGTRLLDSLKERELNWMLLLLWDSLKKRGDLIEVVALVSKGFEMHG